MTVEPHFGTLLQADEVFASFLSMLRHARSEVVLVSPFISYSLFESCLDQIPEGVDLLLITRWSAPELALGLNDLRIKDLLERRSSSELRLVWNLHAKYYRSDGQVLLGSGNLTRKGLGVRNLGNAEVMAKLPQDFSGVRDFELKIRQSSVSPTEDLYNDLLIEVDRLKANAPQMISDRENDELTNGSAQVGAWKPRCEMPSILFSVYKNKTQAIDKKARELATLDLEYLDPPVGLTKKEFEGFIRNALAQSSLFARVLHEIDVSGPITEQVGCMIVSESYPEENIEDVLVIWLASQQWLSYFYPSEFQIRYIR